MVLDLQAIAYEIKAAQDEVRRIAPFTSRVPGFDDAAAYEVSRLVHDMRLREGAVAVGRKIGFTNPDLWDVYGVRAPIWAHVYDRTVVMLPASTGTCRLSRFAEPKIEPEIVVHFRSAPRPASDPADILACIDWFAHGFEIVQSHFPGWKFRSADTIADAALHGTLLIGEPQHVRKLGSDLIAAQARFAIELSCDGRLRERGKGSNVLGGPLAAIAHLIDVLGRQPGAHALAAGELVTTGTLTAALPVSTGETWTTRLEGIALPGLSVTFEA